VKDHLPFLQKCRPPEKCRPGALPPSRCPDHRQKTPNPKFSNLLKIETKRHFVSLEGLNSSLTLASGELRANKSWHYRAFWGPSRVERTKTKFCLRLLGHRLENCISRPISDGPMAWLESRETTLWWLEVSHVFTQ